MGVGKIDPSFYEDLPLDMWEVLNGEDDSVEGIIGEETGIGET